MEKFDSRFCTRRITGQKGHQSSAAEILRKRRRVREKSAESYKGEGMRRQESMHLTLEWLVAPCRGNRKGKERRII